MAALSTGGPEAPSFGHKARACYGCTGCVGYTCNGCTGYSCTGCSGYTCGGGCYAVRVSHGCTGCYGSHKHHRRMRGCWSASCHGCYSTSCHGSSCSGWSCHGSACYGSSCYGSTGVGYNYTPAYISCHGCRGGVYPGTASYRALSVYDSGLGAGCMGNYGAPAGVVVPPAAYPSTTVPPAYAEPVPEGTPEAKPEEKPEEKPADGNGVSATGEVAQLIVDVPEGAKLYVDGNLIEGAAGIRRFHTPKLAAGRAYFYDVKIVADDVIEEKRIVVRPGAVARATFDIAPAVDPRSLASTD